MYAISVAFSFCSQREYVFEVTPEFVQWKFIFTRKIIKSILQEKFGDKCQQNFYHKFGNTKFYTDTS